MSRANALEASGRWRQAQKLYRRVLASDPGSLAAHLGLAHVCAALGRSREESVWLKRARRLDAGRLGSPRERFQALMRLGRCAEAFAVGESILDAGPALEDLRAFWDPWRSDSLPAPAAFRASRRRDLSRAVKAMPRSPWGYYFRGALREGRPRFEDFRRLDRFPRGRYGWMRLKAGWAFLTDGRFEEAAARLKSALGARPSDWWARGFLAEAHACLGRPGAALSELDRARREAPTEELGAALAWRGEIELWLGRYRSALKDLEKASALGSLFAGAWKGAALLKLGRRREALRELDRAVENYPRDREAYVWRGEARRELGLYKKSLEDLSREPVGVWALFNRALAREALGDRRGLSRDFSAIPRSIREHVAKRLGLPKGRAPDERTMRDVLEAGLKFARGYRRDDYAQRVWMI